MGEKTLLRIDSLLKRIDEIFKDTKDVSLDELGASSLLLRATCFSLSQVGEQMNKLEEFLGLKYFNLPWKSARQMRNIIVHDYEGTDVEQVYSTIHEDLTELRTAFLAIKNDIENSALITERLILRKLKQEDAEAIFHNWASDPEVARYVTWPAHTSIETTNALVKAWLKEESEPKTIRYMITIKGSDEPIGSIDVVGYLDGCPKIGYCLSRKQWNHGYMSEACNALIDYLFAVGFPKVVIEADERNVGSNRVIEKCGFTFTHKEKKEHCSAFKPEPVVVNWYEIKRR